MQIKYFYDYFWFRIKLDTTPKKILKIGPKSSQSRFNMLIVLYTHVLCMLLQNKTKLRNFMKQTPTFFSSTICFISPQTSCRRGC